MKTPTLDDIIVKELVPEKYCVNIEAIIEVYEEREVYANSEEQAKSEALKYLDMGIIQRPSQCITHIAVKKLNETVEERDIPAKEQITIEDLLGGVD